MLKVDLIDDLALEHLGNIGIDFEKFARAIESAATAPLLARIAELERELEEARKDAELLDWMIFYSARVGHDSDGEFCQCIWINEDGEQRTKLFGNAREAIRAAIKEQT